MLNYLRLCYSWAHLRAACRCDTQQRIASQTFSNLYCPTRMPPFSPGSLPGDLIMPLVSIITYGKNKPLTSNHHKS
eukprot:3473056-Pleurochrysis_carterae.AAC.1